MRPDHDYLGRPEITGDVPEWYTNKTVMVVGGAGTIGQALMKKFLNHSTVIPIAVDQDEYGLFGLHGQKHLIYVADITHEAELRRVFIKTEPEVIFHCAAYKHVPLMEQNIEAAIHNNVMGTSTLCKVAKDFQVETLVHISTDKAVNPKSVMGRTKRLAEDIIKSHGYTNVRFGNVLNSRGSLLETWRDQARAGLPLTLTDNRCTRYLMTDQEAAYLLTEAGSLDSGTFVLEMGTPIRIVDLAGQFLYHEYPKGKIVVTGLRPGEKIHEQLLDDHETKVSVGGPGVYRITEKAL